MSALAALDLASGFLIGDMSPGGLIAAAAVIVLVGFSIAVILKGFRNRPPRD